MTYHIKSNEDLDNLINYVKKDKINIAISVQNYYNSLSENQLNQEIVDNKLSILINECKQNNNSITLRMPEMKRYKLYLELRNKLIYLSRNNNYSKLIITINSEQEILDDIDNLIDIANKHNIKYQLVKGISKIFNKNKDSYLTENFKKIALKLQRHNIPTIYATHDINLINFLNKNKKK